MNSLSMKYALLLSNKDRTMRLIKAFIIGDAPYGPATGTGNNRVQVYPSAPYERMIAHINAAKKPEFVIHVGDIKEGNSRCDDNVYTVNREYFNTFEMPAIFVPGDNEWTDCHRPTNGSYDPIER